MDATAAAAIKIQFTTETCGRCSGTGMFGPLSVNGGRCFRCGGAKVTKDRAGTFALKAFNAIVEAHTARIADVKVGDKVKFASNWHGVLTAPEPTETGEVGKDNVKVEVFNRREGGRKVMYMAADTQVVLWDAEVWVAAATRVSRLKGAMVEGL